MASRFAPLSLPVLRRPMSAASIAALLVCTGVLSACGGGGGGGAGDSAATPPVAANTGTGGDVAAGDGATIPTTKVAVTVIDGPIKDALVCLDKNLNGGCDTGEPSGKTTADGKVELDVATEDVGKFPLVAVVGTDAVDRDHGPVTVPFTLKTPAGSAAVVSPLTTLVQAQMASGGLTSAEAEAQVKAALGLSGSLFADFTAATDSASLQAANTARLVVVVTQKQNAAIQNAIGSTDASGGTVSQQDLDAAVNQAVLNMMPSIADAIATNAGGTQEEINAAINSSATSLASSAGLTASNVVAVVGGNKLIDQSAAAGTADTATTSVGWNLRWFQFADTSNWLIRAGSTTAAQAVPDADGLIRFNDYRERSINGVNLEWGQDPSFTRTDLYWDGASWWNCPTDFESTQTVRDASGTSKSTYCKTIITTSKRGTRDISGVAMSDIVREIRAYPLSDSFGVNYGGFANWGPNPDSGIFGSATFPAGSKMFYQSYTDYVYPDSYRPADVLSVSPADVAAGPSCPDAPTSAAATSLEQVIARNAGTPCQYTASSQTGSRNEWWGNSTVAIGPITNTSAPFSSYYSAARTLRVAFGADNTATYYNCAVRASNGSPRNCDPAGTGTYSIETLGDARVLRLAGVPAVGAPITYDRLLVERAGSVYLGSKTKPVSGNQIRLNDKAASAMFTQVGLPQLAD